MSKNSKYWSDFITDGKAIIRINLYQKIHLYILTKMLRRLKISRVPRISVIGTMMWGYLEFLKYLCRFTSPKSFDLFWFWVESRGILKSMHKEKLGRNLYEYTFVRKKYINPKDINMTYRNYAAIHKVRDHI